MSEFGFDILVHLTISSHLVPLFLLIYLINRVSDEIIRALFILTLIVFLTEITSIFFARIFENNNPVIHVYTFLAGLITIYIYIIVFNESSVKKILIVFSILFSLFCIFTFFFHKGYLEENIGPNIILTITIIFLSLRYFYKTFSEMKILNLFRHGFFWINSAFLVYYSTTFYISIFEDLIRFNINLILFIWPIQLLTTILFNLILAKGIWTMIKSSY